MSWYKDRDFPELKREVSGGPNEILAFIPNEEDLDRIIKAHNEEVDVLKKQIRQLKKQIKTMFDPNEDFEK